MRSIRCFLSAFALLLIITASASSQGKDKDKENDKEKTAGFKFPTQISGKDLKTWTTKDLRDPNDPTLRQHALQTIPHFGPASKESFAPLMAALKESDAGLRVDAISAVSRVMMFMDPKKDEEDLKKGIAALTPLVTDDQRAVRLAAIGALPYFGVYGRPSLKYLALASEDKQSWEVRKAAVHAMGFVGRSLDPKEGPEPTAFLQLRAALRDSCAPVRLEAILALSNLGPPKATDLAREIDDVKLRTKDRDRVVVLWAYTLLMFLDEKTYLNNGNLKLIASEMADAEPLYVRIQAASALAQLGRKAAPMVDKLIDAATDKEPSLAVAAITALSRMDDNSAVAPMLKLVNDKDTSMDVRCAAVQCLGLLGPSAKAAVPDLTNHLKNKDENINLRCASARNVGLLGTNAKAAVPVLTECLKDKDADLVLACLEGCVNLGNDAVGKEALATIKDMRDSKDDQIKTGATEAYKRLTTDKPKN